MIIHKTDRRAASLAVAIAACLGAASARAQAPAGVGAVPVPALTPATAPVPSPADLPPGAATVEVGAPMLPPEVQVVRFQGPEGVVVEVLGPNPEPVPVGDGKGLATVGLRVGVGYRLRLTNLPERPGAELYPVVEVVGHLHRPPGIDPAKFPIRVVFSLDDIFDAVDRGRLVTQVVYLEDPEQALPDRPAQGRDPDRVAHPGRGAAEGRLEAGAGDGDRPARGPAADPRGAELRGRGGPGGRDGPGAVPVRRAGGRRVAPCPAARSAGRPLPPGSPGSPATNISATAATTPSRRTSAATAASAGSTRATRSSSSATIAARGSCPPTASASTRRGSPWSGPASGRMRTWSSSRRSARRWSSSSRWRRSGRNRSGSCRTRPPRRAATAPGPRRWSAASSRASTPSCAS